MGLSTESQVGLLSDSSVAIGRRCASASVRSRGHLHRWHGFRARWRFIAFAPYQTRTAVAEVHLLVIVSLTELAQN